MRDSLGGLVSIFIIVIFVVLIMGYLAFNVNYTKAFRMRDKVIDTLNRNNGVCGKYCRNEINQYAADIGYMGFDKAQTTRGGVPLSELTDLLESRKKPGLFFSGEVVDVDGTCGGYNLQWAFSSGHRAAEGILLRYLG